MVLNAHINHKAYYEWTATSTFTQLLSSVSNKVLQYLTAVLGSIKGCGVTVRN